MSTAAVGGVNAGADTSPARPRAKGSARPPRDSAIADVRYPAAVATPGRDNPGRLDAVGALGLAGCWFGASDEPNWHHQIPWVVGGVAATAVAGAGVVHWLLRGQRTIVTVSAQLWDEIRRASAAAVAVEQPALAGNEAELPGGGRSSDDPLPPPLV